MKRKLVTAAAAIVAICAVTRSQAAEEPNGSSDAAAVRIKAAGLGTDEPLKGKIVHAQGCTMVKLDRPSPGGYSSLLLVGISQMQVYKSGRWVEMAIAPMLKAEPAHCRASGSD